MNLHVDKIQWTPGVWSIFCLCKQGFVTVREPADRARGVWVVMSYAVVGCIEFVIGFIELVLAYCSRVLKIGWADVSF